MPADNAHYLVAAARQRATATRRRAVAALRRMDTTGTAVTFETVAREARVSRSWLYNQPDLRAEIERLRARHRSPATRALPDRQRASDSSLLQRLQAATERNQRLETENRELRHALALALGEQRTSDLPGHTRDTPGRRSSPVIGPC
jgi:hypothetical protein